MTPPTYNLLEAIVRALNEVIDAALENEQASEFRHDLHSKLTSAKIAMQREQNADIVQSMAHVVIALSQFVLARKPSVGPLVVEKKHLTEALKGLQRRFRETQDPLHPTGRCTCAGEGVCEWCQAHCLHCGRTEEQHKPTDDHAFESHKLACPDCGNTADIDLAMGVCGHCGYKFSYADLPPKTPKKPESEYELQHGGELREKDPVIEDKTNEDIGLDRLRWRPITDKAGYPAVALYFNNRKDSLSIEQREELEKAILPVIGAWEVKRS